MRLSGFCSSALLLLAASLAHAQTPSFDCTRAATTREYAVCDNTSLRKLDGEMGKEFSRVHRGVPEPASAAVLADQRAWLAGLDASCTAKPNAQPAFITCLTDEYKARLNELTQDKPLDDDHWLITTRAGGDMRPIILTPSPSEQTWNHAIAAQIAHRSADANKELASCRKEATGEGGDTVDNMDVDAWWHIAGANTHIIVTKFTLQEYCGGAHPSTTFEDWNWSLDLNRPLAPDDVLISSSGWQSLVIAAATSQLNSDYPDTASYRWKDKEFSDGMNQAVSSTNEWQLTRNGLGIQFQQYQIASYVFGMPSVCIPWKDLRPYLNPTFNPAQLPASIPDPADQ